MYPIPSGQPQKPPVIQFGTPHLKHGWGSGFLRGLRGGWGFKIEIGVHPRHPRGGSRVFEGVWGFRLAPQTPEIPQQARVRRTRDSILLDAAHGTTAPGERGDVGAGAEEGL